MNHCQHTEADGDLECLRNEVKFNPSATAARARLGRLLLASGQAHSAAHWLKEATVLRPRAVRRRVIALVHREYLLSKFRQGETLDHAVAWRLRRSEDEVRMWQDGLAPAPVDDSVWFALAEASLRAFDEARAAGKTQEEIDNFLASKDKAGCAWCTEEFDE